jgi:hypothetical protein
MVEKRKLKMIIYKYKRSFQISRNLPPQIDEYTFDTNEVKRRTKELMKDPNIIKKSIVVYGLKKVI